MKIPTCILVILSVWLVFITYVIGFNYTPLEGTGDQTGWEYSGYFLFENLTFTPFPSLQFFSNQTFYPYGITSVFMSWGLERDYFYALLRTYFGMGPWLQLYYALSLLLTSLGCFALLYREFGKEKALFAALAIPFLNIYGISKYPWHLGIAVCHWSILSVVSDFLILQAVMRNRLPSAHLLVLRFVFTLLSFGQELAYIMGISLSSLCLTLGAIVLKLTIDLKRSRASWLTFKAQALKALAVWANQLRNHILLMVFYGVIIGLFCFFMAPLLLQIIIESQKYQDNSFYSGGWHASPWRVLFPYFSFFHPSNYEHLGIYLSETAEGFGPNSPGWFLLILGLAGLWWQRYMLAPVLALITLFLMCLYFDPGSFPTLKIFPWYKYARVGQRVAVVCSTVFTLLALGIPLSRWKLRSTRRYLRYSGIALLLGILGLELPIMYHAHQGEHHPTLPESFTNVMDTIRTSPGEAVLDWPFCYSGGNGVGFCPNEFGLSMYGLRKYHEKKVMGAYYARMSLDQAEVYKQQGLQSLLQAQAKGCLDEGMLRFLKRFYLLNDFSGVLLHTSMIAPECLPALRQTFAGHEISSDGSPFGGLVYLQKTAEQRQRVKSEQGIKLRYVERAAALQGVKK